MSVSEIYCSVYLTEDTFTSAPLFLSHALDRESLFLSASFFFFQSRSKLLFQSLRETRVALDGLEIEKMAHFMNKYLPAVLHFADSNRD